MSLVMAGIDYNRAGVDIRSAFSFSKPEQNEAYAALQTHREIAGSVLISTCNRTELWISTAAGETVDPGRLLCELKGISYENSRCWLFGCSEKEAADHLFRLASGLESRILGEDQIITQVKDALGKARENFAADHVLEVLFRQAVTAGKRVKSEVNLSTADRSVIHQALRYLEQRGYTAAGKRCMVIGNGMMGRLAAETLRSAGADVTVTVRQYHSGAVSVPEGCSRIDYEDRFEELPSCDMVVSATSSPNMTVQRRHLEKIHLKQDLILIDLAVPRDIEQSCGELPGITLFDIDSFEVDLTNERLLENIRKAEVILKEEMEEFLSYYEGRDLLPMIASVKSAAAGDIQARLTPVLKKMPDEREVLERQVGAAAERMMNRMLFTLRDELEPDVFRRMLEAMDHIWKE